MQGNPCTVSINQTDKEFRAHLGIGSTPPFSYHWRCVPRPKSDNKGLREPITVDEVTKAINSLSKKSSADPNGLDFDILIKVPEHVTALTGMFNSWLVAGRVPQESIQVWSILLMKGGDPCSINNWRPITVGDAEIWLFDKVLSKRLKDLCVISPRHAGFMKERGTYDHLFMLESVTTLAHESRNPVNVAFLDLSKTFDTKPHPDQ